MTYMVYCHGWQALPDREKENIHDFFEYDNAGKWIWRQFHEQTDGSVVLEAEFTDANAAMIFKLRFGGK